MVYKLNRGQNEREIQRKEEFKFGSSWMASKGRKLMQKYDSTLLAEVLTHDNDVFSNNHRVVLRRRKKKNLT